MENTNCFSDFSGKNFIKENVLDLVPPTILGLLEDLVPGSELSNKFIAEFEKFSNIEEMSISYGTWVYFPNTQKLVRFMEPYWHRLALLARNSTLILDPEMKMRWHQVREIFDKSVIAVAGCSLGNNIAHAIAWDLRPLPP